MSILHLCNTYFEWELVDELPSDLYSACSLTPIFEQLQFLPLCYAGPGEGVLVTERPNEPTPLPLFLINEEIPYTTLSTWGYSKMAKKWAESRGIEYLMPDFDIVKMVNAKSFSFARCPLPGARLLYQGDHIEEQTVLKSCFGTAGRGHVFSHHPNAITFCKGQWEKGLPVLSEPWVRRHYDFSTQWIITPSREVHYLGATICKTSKKGIHQSNIVGHPIPHLEPQQERALPVLEEMASMGYFGHVGIDAMVYGDNLLQPIVEINARKTMGWLALQIQQSHGWKTPIEVSYIKSTEPGILPQSLKNTYFERQLTIKRL